jgi:hypothetical protein
LGFGLTQVALTLRSGGALSVTIFTAPLIPDDPSGYSAPTRYHMLRLGRRSPSLGKSLGDFTGVGVRSSQGPFEVAERKM